MVYFVGGGTEVKEDIWACKCACQSCGEEQNFHFFKYKVFGNLFYIKFISITKKRGIMCDKCTAYKELSRKEYNKLLAEQRAKLKASDFPNDVVLHDFEPKKLKIGLNTFLKVLAFINFFFWMFTVLVSSVSMANEGVPVAGILALEALFLFLGIFPLVCAIKNLKNKKHQKAMYDAALERSKNAGETPAEVK